MAIAMDELLEEENVFFSVVLFDVFNVFFILNILDLISLFCFRRSFIVLTRYFYLFLFLPVIELTIVFAFNLRNNDGSQIIIFALLASLIHVFLFRLYKDTISDHWGTSKIRKRTYFLYIALPTLILYKVLTYYYG